MFLRGMFDCCFDSEISCMLTNYYSKALGTTWNIRCDIRVCNSEGITAHCDYNVVIIGRHTIIIVSRELKQMDRCHTHYLLNSNMVQGSSEWYPS